MVTDLCRDKLQEYEILVSHHRKFMLSFCVLTFTFSFVATLGNLLVIRALWKASSLPKNLKMLFINLAVSDLAVGSVVHSMLGAIIAIVLYKEARGNHNQTVNMLCPTTITIFLFLLLILVSASFFTISAIAIDRFLAISLPLRYQGLVTSKRVFFVSISVWLIGFAIGAAYISIAARYNLAVVVAAQLYGLVVATAIYIYIYKIARYHKNQILTQCQLQNDQAMKVLREKKSAISALLVYIVLMVCYVPNLACSVLLLIDKFQITFLVANRASLFLVLLNSSLNPLIYCWRYRELREMVRKMVCQVFRIGSN
ncbi:adenosine receptor A2a-like [Stylophora pistillata]|uniref:adenosine receptor A2a-like n=1 Tax=Stylophora pistillata TaxID=50429 RepID=UPI000C0432DB|nr:adenosine receptor A2a-like [Stylophora pistillata]